MKLFTKYNRINLLTTIIIFLLSATAFYFVIRYILINQVDSDLKIEEREIEKDGPPVVMAEPRLHEVQAKGHAQCDQGPYECQSCGDQQIGCKNKNVDNIFGSDQN